MACRETGSGIISGYRSFGWRCRRVAQAKGGSFKEQILGSWVLVSNVNEQDGKKSDVFGPNPRGFMTLTPSGHFTMIMMNASLPKFASNNRVKGTAEENQAVVQGSVAMFGTIR